MDNYQTILSVIAFVVVWVFGVFASMKIKSFLRKFNDGCSKKY